MNKIKNNKKISGFAMLFTVLIISLILSISISISNITFKQTILSSLAKDSQLAFYQADKAVECGMYYDTQDVFPLGTAPADVRSGNIQCGNETFILDERFSQTDYLFFAQDVTSQSAPCSSLIFDKLTNAGVGEFIVRGIGYNTCAGTPRQVERALQVVYTP